MAIQAEPTAQERLVTIASELDPETLKHLLVFAEFLQFQEWRDERQAFALSNLERAYGDDEPEYALADIKS